VAITLSVQSDNDLEHRLLMPRTYNWEEFEALEALLAESPSLRITYLDGLIEIMTLGEPHELIKKSLAILLVIADCKRIRLLQIYKKYFKGKNLIH
jgi:Uma2 family endonuclease